MKQRKVLAGVGLLLLAASIFLFGILTHAKQWPPVPYLSQWRNDLRATRLWPTAEIGIRSDVAAREARPCPPAGPRTMVALVFGQSHAANTVGERFQAQPGVFNVFDGKCYAARDPLLGANHHWGNLWTLVGDELVASGAFDNVMLVMAAVGGSTLAEWAPRGKLHDYLMKTARSLETDFKFTHVFLLQGESDLVAGTPYDRYRAQLLAVIGALRQEGIRAPIFIATESGFCGSEVRAPPPNNAIVRAQKDVVEAGRDILAGPDMDRDVATENDRYDGCHLSGSGARKLSRLWFGIIAPNAAKP